MRRGLGLLLGLCLAVAAVAPGPARAQVQGDLAAPLLTLDQDRLFTGTAFGRATLSALEAEAEALQQESRRIDAAMEDEERALTARRPGMDPAEFRTLADAFDAKVNGLRAAQETKARELARKRDAERQRFFQAAVPVLGEIMRERGAVAIVDKSALVLSFDRVDITDAAIARIDAVLGADGTAPSAPAPAAPPPAPSEVPPQGPSPGPPAAP